MFFFQAEDGIRDAVVTGVQTCALPISAQRDFGPHAGSCQLAQSGGDLLLVVETQGSDAQRLRQLAGAGTADKTVRRTDQPAGQAVRLDVHQIRSLQPAPTLGSKGGCGLPSERTLTSRTLHVFAEWH